ncbi:hypothetical protein JSY14_11240 [Brachybacterium sp. EF45031]|nr:hypothetical protein [Brachybacterium sillae]
METSGGNPLGQSILLFILLFGAFIAGLYVMSLLTPVTFLVGLAVCILALFGAFAVVPKFLS